ncbi:MAG: CsbD family protein [Capsulimonas sp.]|uniref:CsbD family protein n=1 Tax=Capsulimonas sp. TaxID=2494211 RepID=UPI003267C1D2|nr:CsbD-like [Capsulimonas sp.]
MAINEDIVEGKLKQAEGKAQDVRGDLTNNPDDDAAGKAKQVEGKIQEGFGKAKEAVKDALD